MKSNEYLDFLYSERFSREWKCVNYVIDPARSISIKPLPKRYEGTRLGEYLLTHSASPHGVYAHQALTAEELDQGHNVVLCTTTGSGKSRAFMTAGFDLVMSDPNATVLVLNPLVQLNKDQTLKWKEMAEELGLSPATIGVIDGSVREDRLKLIGECRILLATPDVVHRYMMPNLDKPEIRDFLKSRRLTVLDEIDSYHAGFGTNVAFMLRRMQFIQQALTGDDFTSHRYIGASATLPNPREFFKELTGQEAVDIPEESNGAPRPERTIVHHALFYDEDKMSQAESVIAKMLSQEDMGQGLVFIDSRSKVEDMAARLNEKFGADTAVVQKAGLLSEVQGDIDHKMRSGKARVIIATSSMEAGVDLDFQWGMQIDLPAALTSLRQRIGRVGRKQDGLFILMAGKSSMGADFETINTLEQYLQHTPLEEPQLYLNNEFIQIAQALCLTEEVNKLKAAKVPLKKAPETHKVEWPYGFSKQLAKAANPEVSLTGEKRVLLPPKKTRQPIHAFHSLRKLSGGSMVLCRPFPKSRDFQIMGSVQTDQALREFPPGAIAWHGQKTWRVWNWKGNNIIITPYQGTHRTKHLISDYMRIHVSNDNLARNTLKAGPEIEVGEENYNRPVLTLVRGKMTQTVKSFVEWDGKNREKTYAYVFRDDHDLARADIPKNSIDYGPPRRTSISTTGLLFHMPSMDRRILHYYMEDICNEILDEYCAAMSYERHNIKWTNRGYAILPDGELIKGAYYFYDTTPGSLGLSHGLVKDKKHNIYEIIKRLRDRAPEAQRTHRRTLKDLLRILDSVTNVELDDICAKAKSNLEIPDGYMAVIPPGEFGSYHDFSAGLSRRVKILKPVIMQETPGYHVEKFNREAAFRSSECVTFDKKTGEFYVPKRAKADEAPSVATHFIAAAFITFDSPVAMIMNTQTGVLMVPDPKQEGQWIEYSENAL